MNVGAIRRIDNLGRIVIPKSLRKTMRIKSGDNIEIYEENEKIILKKYSELSKIEEIGTYIVEILKENLQAHIYITDKDMIILDSNGNKGLKLKEKIIKIINTRKIKIDNNQINIANKIQITNYAIVPIIVNGDLFGALIINKKEKINQRDIEYIKLFIELIKKYIE